MQREAIYLALLGQLQALLNPPYNFLVVSRGFKTWDQAADQPACYIVPKSENSQYKRGLPTKYVFHLDLYVYVRWVDSVAQGVSSLAVAMDGIDNILSPLGPNGGPAPNGDNGFVNTLGGLAVYCAIQGDADISGGYLNDSQTVARMPVEIVVA